MGSRSCGAANAVSEGSAHEMARSPSFSNVGNFNDQPIGPMSLQPRCTRCRRERGKGPAAASVATSLAHASNWAFGSYAPTPRSRGDLDARGTRERRGNAAAEHDEPRRKLGGHEQPRRSQRGSRSNQSQPGAPTRSDHRGRRSHFHTTECSSETLPRPRRSDVRLASPSEDLSLDPCAHIRPVTRRQSAGIHCGAPSLDLDRPRSIDVALRLLVQTFQEPRRDFRPLVLRKAQCLFKQGGGIDHGSGV